MYVLADLAFRGIAIYTAASYIPGLKNLSRRNRLAIGAAFAPLSWMKYPASWIGNTGGYIWSHASETMPYFFPYEDIWSNLAHSATNHLPALAIIGFEAAFLMEALETKRRLDVYGVKSNFAHGAAYFSAASCAIPMATACLLPFAPAIGIAAIGFGAHILSDWAATLYIRAAKDARQRDLDRD